MDTAAVLTEDAGILRHEVDRLKADLQRLRLDLSELSGDAVHAAKSGTTMARDRVTEKARAAAAQSRESAEVVEEQVAAHPFMSLATAFAVGMMVGLGVCKD